ncbi:MAG: gamma-glutamylcyclotransferase [Oscillospiraceae bacterium]|nr:gamma-glutamylcyclotransferase [Oscillospiraceae bacterium]
MNGENKIYVAYGSNLNLEQMKFRCPYATVIGGGTLPDYQLLFRGGDGGSVATVEPKKDGSVPVLLWEITPRDEQSLDRYEGYPHLYRKETVEVQYGEKLVEAMVYIMNGNRPLGTPSEYYLNAILEGYESADFDKEVLEQAVRNSK